MKIKCHSTGFMETWAAYIKLQRRCDSLQTSRLTRPRKQNNPL